MDDALAEVVAVTLKQVHWIGEAAQLLLLAGVLYLVIRMTGGAAYQPRFAMPLPLRIAGVLLFVALGATIRTWRHYRRLRKRRSIA